MINFERCKLCDALIPDSKDGRTAHMKRFHNVIARTEVPRYTADEKARIVAQGEARIGQQYFMETTTVSPALVERALAVDVPATFCLVEENICVWEKHGLDLCGPCQTRKEYLATLPVTVEEVRYID